MSLLTDFSDRLTSWFPIVDRGPLAEPWRRLTAAALDTSLLLLVFTVVMAISLFADWSTDRLLTIAIWMTPLVAWLYVWTSWATGATLGMRLVGIRVIRLAESDGRSPGFAVSALRIIGYALACLPAKGGLVPILTDPLRQGWHDRIASTLVVKLSHLPLASGSLPRRPDRVNAPEQTIASPDIRLAFRGSVWALVGFILLTIAMTYPVAWRLKSQLAGLTGDSDIFVWDYWFVSQALQHHTSLTQTNLLYYPNVVSLLYSTVDWLNGFFAAMLLPRLGPIGTYNTLWLGSLSLCMFTAYLLAAAVTRSRTAAFVVAPIYGLSPFFMAHALGHANIISAEFLPLFVLFFYAALTTGRSWYGGMSGIAIGLGGLCDLQFLLFGTVAGIAMLIGFWWKVARIDHAVVRKQLAALACAGLGVLLVIGWIVGPALGRQTHDTSMDRVSAYPASVTGYIVPSPLQTWNRPDRAIPSLAGRLNYESFVAPGLVAFILAALGAARVSRRVRVWWAMLVGATVLSFGPFLETGSSYTNSLLSLLLFGFPGNGFALPWRFGDFVQETLLVAGGQISVKSSSETLWMPFSWIYTLLPAIRAFRAPARLDLVVLIALGVLAAYGVLHLLDKIRKRVASSLFRLCAAAVLLALMLAEYISAPYPMSDTPHRPVLDRIADVQDQSPVLNVPLGPLSQYQYEQAIHHHPVFAGFLSRTPRTAYSVIQQNPLLLYSSRCGDVELPVNITEQDRSPASLVCGLRMLQALGTRYALVHKAELATSSASEVNQTFVVDLKARKVAEDSEYVLYDISR